jgi:hypothetical protein
MSYQTPTDSTTRQLYKLGQCATDPATGRCYVYARVGEVFRWVRVVRAAKALMMAH